MYQDRGGLEKSGWCRKKADVLPNWNERFMRLDPLKLDLLYYKTIPQSVDTPCRGTFDLTGCICRIDPQHNTRFSITSRDEKSTYHLEAPSTFAREEWMRAIIIISRLGVLQEEESTEILGTCEKLIKRLQARARERKEELASVADEKYKSKTRLIELRDEMLRKKQELIEKMEMNTDRHKQTREECYRLSANLENLQEQVRASNILQQRITEIFASDSGDLRTKAERSLVFCEKEFEKKQPEVPDTEIHVRGRVNFVQGMKECIEEVLKLVLQDEITVGSPVCFYDNNLQDWIPGEAIQISENEVQVRTRDDKEMWHKMMVLKLDKPDIKDPAVEAEEVFHLYCLFYERYHSPREQEQIRIHTQYQEKYNKLKVMSSQMSLHTRKQREAEWILEEMNRAIDRLDKEGVVIDSSGFKKQNSDLGKEDDMLHVLAHRQTWSEASSTIFQLNAKRYQEHQCTKDLEHALHDREMLRSWLVDQKDQD